MADLPAIIAGVVGGGVAAGAYFYVAGRHVGRRAAEALARAATAESERLLEEARQRVVLAAKAELLQARETWEEEVAERRRSIERREQTLDHRSSALEDRERELERRHEAARARERELAQRDHEARARLEEIAGLSALEAKQELLRRLEDEARSEAAALVRDLKEQARRNAEKDAKKILALARCGRDHRRHSGHGGRLLLRSRPP